MKQIQLSGNISRRKCIWVPSNHLVPVGFQLATLPSNPSGSVCWNTLSIQILAIALTWTTLVPTCQQIPTRKKRQEPHWLDNSNESKELHQLTNHIGSNLPTYYNKSKERQGPYWLKDSNELKDLNQLTNHIGSNLPTDSNESKERQKQHWLEDSNESKGLQPQELREPEHLTLHQAFTKEIK